MDENEYFAQPSLLWCYTVYALVAFAACIGLLIAPELLPDLRQPAGRITAYALSVLFGGFACGQLRLMSVAQRHAIVVSPLGFRRVGEPAHQVVAWSAVTRLRDCPSWQRVELLASSGQRLGLLVYQLVGFEDALQRVMQYSGYPSSKVSLPQHFPPGADRSQAIAFAVLLAFAGYSGYRFGPAPALILAGSCAVLIALRWFSRHGGVSVDLDGISLRVGSKTVRHRPDEVAHVELVRRHMGHGLAKLDLVVQKRTGEVHSVLPERVDPFAVLAAVRRVHRSESQPSS